MTTRTRFLFDRSMLAALAGALVMLQILLFSAGFLVGAASEVRALTPLPPSPPPAFGRPNPSQGEGGMTRLASTIFARVAGALSRAAGEGRGGGLPQAEACAIPAAALAPEPRPQPVPAPVVVAAIHLPAKPRPSPLATFMAPSLLVKASFKPPAKPERPRYVPRTLRSAADYAAMIREAAIRHSLSPALVEAVIRVESAFNPRAVSHKGARGLMQVMPATGRRFGGRSNGLFDPEYNLAVGTAYLAWLSKRYRGNLDFVLAAYNAGEGAVDDHGGIPPYRETRNYVRKVRSALRSIEALAAEKEGVPVAAVPAAVEMEEPAGIVQLSFPPALTGDQKARPSLSAGERAVAQEGADHTGAGGG